MTSLGLMSGLCVWIGATLATLPFAGITFFAIPLLMWMTLRYVSLLVKAFGLTNAKREQVAGGCDCGIPCFRFAISTAYGG